MENVLKILDTTNDKDMFALHYVFLPRIQKLLDEWVEAWNNHPMRTERNMSPNQIRIEGYLKNFKSSNPAVLDVFDRCQTEVSDDYGQDPQEEPTEIATMTQFDGLEVPEVCTDDHDLYRNALQHINPLRDDENYGIEVYRECAMILKKL